MKTVCVTGAAGNLGSLTARHLLENTSHSMRLMIHRTPLGFTVDRARGRVVACDLARPETLVQAMEGVDEVVHFAGVLFKANPGRFLPTTNTLYFRNLVDAAKSTGVKRIILVSFPHVEGETSPDLPSTDRLDGTPNSHHARTRLEEEKILLEAFPRSVVLRVGMVYGRGILMPDAARWFARHRLLGVWRKPTWIHLISKEDFLEVVARTLANENASGIYNIGDDGIQTLQDYLDFACDLWGCSRPWRMPESLIFAAARAFETFSAIFGTRSPLTRDFVRIGMASYYGDTTRMKRDILPELRFSKMKDGAGTF